MTPSFVSAPPSIVSCLAVLTEIHAPGFLRVISVSNTDALRLEPNTPYIKIKTFHGLLLVT